ncbi:MAG TPA: polymorphic toxin-type HINT domain-containing protein [Pirellulales bacterium]|nr:polymorphic toxin-type HINT domain-containing protein [Pirellulales bacterium]
MRQADGGECLIDLLRNGPWLADHGAHLGGGIFFNMPEMSVEGQAEVLAIEPCPPLEPGEGRLITGAFRHASGEVYNLKLESESQPIGVTCTHPFWSCDRETWVSAAELRSGETFKTLTGTSVVERMSERLKLAPVYNVEVEGDHVYRVRESGVLVHNASAPPAGVDYGCEKKSGQGRLDPCTSGILDTSLGQCQTDYQAHHLIACSARNRPALQRAAQLGFDINGALNGWCLPSDVSEARRTGKPLHFRRAFRNGSRRGSADVRTRSWFASTLLGIASRVKAA